MATVTLALVVGSIEGVQACRGGTNFLPPSHTQHAFITHTFYWSQGCVAAVIELFIVTICHVV